MPEFVADFVAGGEPFSNPRMFAGCGWRRDPLTIEEAAGYYHTGEGKLRLPIDEHPKGTFM